MKKNSSIVLLAFLVYALNIEASFQWLTQARSFFGAVISKIHLPTKNQISSTITTPLMHTFSHMGHFLSCHKVAIGTSIASVAAIGFCYWAYKMRFVPKRKNTNQTDEAYFKLSQLYTSMKFHREYAGRGVVPENIDYPHFDYGEQLRIDCGELFARLDQAKQYSGLHSKMDSLYASMNDFGQKLLESQEYQQQKEKYERTDDVLRHKKTCEMLLDLKNVARMDKDCLAENKIKEISFLKHLSLHSSAYSPMYKILQKYSAFKAVRPKYHSEICKQQSIAGELEVSCHKFLTRINQSLVLGYGHVYGELMPQLDQMIEVERQRWANVI